MIFDTKLLTKSTKNYTDNTDVKIDWKLMTPWHVTIDFVPLLCFPVAPPPHFFPLPPCGCFCAVFSPLNSKTRVPMKSPEWEVIHPTFSSTSFSLIGCDLPSFCTLLSDRFSLGLGLPVAPVEHSHNGRWTNKAWSLCSLLLLILEASRNFSLMESIIYSWFLDTSSL